jgi:hypothetical protein
VRQVGGADGMTPEPASYPRHRFPAEVISHAVWLYHVFSLSLRDVELILAERGVVVTHESIRYWCLKFGADFARRLRRRRPQPGDTWHLDEVSIRIRGVLDYLWRAVDQHGGVLDILVQDRAILPDVRHRTSRYLNTEDESSGRLTSTQPATRAADVDSYQPSFRWLAISYLATYLPSSPKHQGWKEQESLPCLVKLV